MRILYTLIILFVCGLVSLSAQTVWTGNADSDWTNPANWSNGVPTTGVTATIPGTPSGGNNPVYTGSPIIDFTIQNAGTITFGDFVYNSGTIINFSGATFITNDNYFVNAGMVTFDNDGNFSNNGTFDNYGTFDNAASAIFANNAGSHLINRGIFRNNGQLTNDGDISNYGNFRSTNNVQNNGLITNLGFMEHPFGSVFMNNAGGTIQNEASGELTANGTFENPGTINNAGDLMIQTACNLVNSNQINNSGLLEISGTLTNNSNYNNTGTTFVNDSGTYDNKANTQNTGSIEISICGNLVQDSGTDITGTVINDGLIFLLNGNVSISGGEFGEVFTELGQTKPPVAGCRSGFVLMLDENGEGTLQVVDIDKGGYGNCGAVLVNKTLSETQFTLADLGTQVVTLTVEDNLGLTASCDAFITVIEFVPPIVAVDDPDLEFACPEDITLTTAPGGATAIASWEEPAPPITNCTPGADCSDLPTYLPGYSYIGEFEGSRYFLADHTTSWNTAQHDALESGGYLAVVNSAEENTYLKDAVNYNAWIGFTDKNSEGSFSWVNGETVNYTNWNNGEPNDYGSGEDYTEMRNNGKWNDLPNSHHRRGLVELPCGAPACTDLSNEIPGFIFLGEFNNSKYYCSSYSNYTWAEARELSAAAGGQLVIVEDEQENEFIRNGIMTDYAWIGLTDEESEGTYKWVNGEESTFFNWNPGEPNNNGGNEDYVRLLKYNGKWTDRNQWFEAEFVMEIECGDENNNGGGGTGEVFVEQISGPDNGAEFFLGTTEVAYRASDDCGNEEICIFNVTVEQVPAEITFDCPTSLVLDAEPGAPGAVANWTEPTASTTCFKDGIALERIDDSPANGELFPIGQSFVVYAITDSCGGLSVCNFSITVNEVAATLTLEECPADFVATSNQVSWTEPVASTTCFTGNITIEQIAGPVNGSSVAQGTYQVVYLLSDDCGNTEVCFFNVSVETTCPDAGTPCDDGDPCTINDVEDGNCGCAGTFVDSDGDGVCDAEDICAGGDDNVDSDGDGIPDFCDDCDTSLEGTPCDDGDPCTTGDVFDANCGCAGTFADSDGDGVCDAEDICAGGDDNTDTDGDGTPDFCDNCDNYTSGGQIGFGPNCEGSFTINGCPAVAPVIEDCISPMGGSGDEEYLWLFSITTGDFPTQQVSNIDNDPNWDILPGADGPSFDPGVVNQTTWYLRCARRAGCDLYTGESNIIMIKCGPCIDSDGDDVCDTDDVCPGSDDNVDSDGDGTPDGCDDCDNSLAGTACDDGDPNTENDVFDDNCNCAGTPVEDICEDIFSIRSVTSVGDNCGQWCNAPYAFTLGPDNCYAAGNDLLFTEFNDGTAVLEGSLRKNGQTGHLIVNFSGRTFDAPAGSPKYELCISNGGEGWYYYPTFDGTFTYPDGSTTTITRRGPAFQVGEGASLQDNGLGGSGWFDSSDGDHGDLNFLLSNQIDCIDDGIYLEAECAEVGHRFNEVSSSTASNGAFVTVQHGYNAYSHAPSNSGDRVRFTVNVATAGDYKVFARVKAPNGGDNSFWVRANNGTWVKWNDIQQSHSFIWDQVHDNDNNNALVTFHLNAGSNTIDFAYREDGTELDKVFITLNGDAPVDLGPIGENCEDESTDCLGEAGSVSFEQANGHYWYQVQLEQSYVNPVVVAYITSRNGGDPVTTRVRNVTSGSFEVQIDEWDYLDGYHAAEDVSYIVVEAGTHVLSDGRVLQAGTTTANGHFSTESYNYDFNSTPVVVAQMMTYNDNAAATVRLRNVSHSSFKVKLQGEEAFEYAGHRHDEETLGWIAMEAGIGITEGSRYEAKTTPDAVKHTGYWWDFEQTFDTRPVMVGGISTYDGGNTTAARFAAFSATGVDMIAEEERSYDNEINHTHEKVSYILFDEGVICSTNSNSGNYESVPGDRLQFFARQAGRQSRLFWVTNTEARNDYFIVERSADGQNFEELYDMDSRNSQEGFFEYELSDVEPLEGINYYRVKQVYADGSFVYSNTEEVVFAIDLEAVVVFPNPATTQVSVSLKQFAGQPALIRIFDQFGREMDAIQIESVTNAPVTFDIENYKAGAYTMYIDLETTRNIARTFIVGRL